MLKCKEFYPEDRTEVFALSRKYEPIETVLERINIWITSEGINVLNVETVPSGCAYHQEERGQTIRVWYEE